MFGMNSPKLLVAVHTESAEKNILSLLSEFNYILRQRLAMPKGDIELYLEPSEMT
jgi:hypothetical protein